MPIRPEDDASADGAENVTLQLRRFLSAFDRESTLDVVDPETSWKLELVRDVVRITLSAHGFRRTLILDVLPHAAIDGFRPLIVSAGDAFELDPSTRGSSTPDVAAPPAKSYVLASAMQTGRLQEVSPADESGPAPAVGADPVSDLRPPREALRALTPGRLYEFLPTQPAALLPNPRIGPTQITFFFDTAQADRDGIRGAGSYPTASQTPEFDANYSGNPVDYLAAQMDGLQAANIVIVGRSSSYRDSSDDGESDDVGDVRNRQFGAERAVTGERLVSDAIEAAGLPDTVVITEVREEREPPRVEVAEEQANLSGAEGRLGQGLPRNTWVNDHYTYQRVDINISRLAGSPEDELQWAPGPDRERVITPIRRLLLPVRRPAPGARRIEYALGGTALKRLRVRARWEREAFPTLMELMVALRKTGVTVDTGTEQINVPASDIQTAENVFRIILRLTNDVRSGQARWTFILDGAGAEDGFWKYENMARGLGTLLLFGPLFGRMAQAEADSDGDPNVAGWVTLSALTALGLVGEVTGAISNVNLILNGLRFDVDTRNGPFDDLETILLRVDYSIEFSVSEPIFGLETEPNSPVRMRLRNVGVAFNFRDGVMSDLAFKFDETDDGGLAIEDAGSFRASRSGGGGILGQLVQVVGARLGQGSVFIELDLKFVLDIGVVEITQTTLRLVFSDGGLDVQVRGLGIRVEIPETLKGEGALALRDNGFRTTLSIEVIPAELYAAGSLEFLDQGDYKSVSVGILVDFPVGLPLGGSGLAIYGFLGNFAANMRRAVPADADRIRAELNWLGRLLAPGDGSRPSPWEPNRERWAFGVGAVVGTLPDGGKSFHAKGALVLEIPGPTVLFGIDAQFINKRRDTKGDDVSDEGTGGGSDVDLRIRGIIGLTPEAFIIGIKVNFELGDLLKIEVPISALFPTDNAPPELAAYLRIGSDNVSPAGGVSRAGDAVTVKLNLSDFLEFKAFCYMMIEERNLFDLGGKPRLDFTGFSIGFGLGISIFLGVRRIGTYLEVESLALAGMGTSPVVIGGVLEASGELSILWISFGVEAGLDFLHRQPGQQLPEGQRGDEPPLTEPETTFEGHFCAELDFFFFSIRECFEFKVGGGDPCKPPPPPPLLTGMSFVDRRGFEVAKIDVNEDGAPVGDVVVWPDAVPVLQLRAEPDVVLDPASPFHTTLTNTDHEALAIGEFEYAFTLKDLHIERWSETGWASVGPRLDASFWWPTNRPAFLSESDAPHPRSTARHGEEVRALGALDLEAGHLVPRHGAGGASEGRRCAPARSRGDLHAAFRLRARLRVF